MRDKTVDRRRGPAAEGKPGDLVGCNVVVGERVNGPSHLNQQFIYRDAVVVAGFYGGTKLLQCDGTQDLLRLPHNRVIAVILG